VAIRLNPRDGGSLLRLAWLRSTAASAETRNGKQAVSLALKLNRALQGSDPTVWDTLAAAQAETGDYDNTVRSARQALELCKDDRPELAEQIGLRLRLYEQRKPYREKEQTQ